ncbi:major facilitator superfamily MFS_1 [Methylobacterium sp. 4-46]|uniref:MFS transporter n=1 Tax=unclassified Methylobacterium TaxID=2615210 RepID=UPI000152D82D|nr:MULTISPECIES: MFS transporter [Methylobacterium]ACA16760.1 major facilitator superfamily MFS_1 [Methylobacterium sp. 4-46]WFT82456.1 MFS transporter [Methylobacterium nodulans]
MSKAIAAGGAPPVSRRPFGRNYAFVVVGVIFLSLLAAAGLRAAPGVLILPLEQAFGWSRATVSFSVGLGIFLYGLVGPFAAALMQSFGIRRTLLCALALMAGSTALSALMTEPWHLVATWGVLSGLGSGCVAIVLGATVVNRWFVVQRGLVMGLLTASTATGTLVFLPGLAAIAEAGGWRPVVLTVAAAVAALIPLVAWLLPERPADIGLLPYGAQPGTVVEPPRRANPFRAAIDGLARASRQSDFWLLFGTFYICGLTTNGLVGTHLISFCADMGLPEVRAAGLLAMMGIFDMVGTTGSGWLTDRYDPRKLLFVYYGVRGLSLMALPFTDFSFYSLSLFAVFYGLDWIATVPPTVRLTNEVFGERDAPIVFGWIAAGHQAGAATAAFGAGLSRAVEGRYLEAFLAAGLTGLVAALMSLMIGRAAKRTLAAA